LSLLRWSAAGRNDAPAIAKGEDLQDGYRVGKALEEGVGSDLGTEGTPDRPHGSSGSSSGRHNSIVGVNSNRLEVMKEANSAGSGSIFHDGCKGKRV
jgi:hypothetical protein